MKNHVVMRIVGAANGLPTELDGLYLREFDPEFANGVGLITGTADRTEAMRFGSKSAAMLFWRQSPRCRRIRPDGRPNRPLTAFTVEIVP
jgi:hypothetical protein